MRADTSAPAREPSRGGADGWAGPVFLPGGRGGTGRLFFARLRGHTRTYPFLPSCDALSIRPAPGAEVLQALVDSHFVGKEWVLREDAEHAKSKTYRRAAVLPELARA